MKEGTRTILFGAHSIIHSVLVIQAWKLIYGKYPKWWQLVCILIHDIGYFGTNFLTEKTNVGHAELGARIARRIFGQKGFDFIVGHSRSSSEKFGLPLSDLEAPDDYSWVIAPKWWLRTNQKVDRFCMDGEEWQRIVISNWEEHGMFNRGSSFDLYKNNTNDPNGDLKEK